MQSSIYSLAALEFITSFNLPHREWQTESIIAQISSKINDEAYDCLGEDETWEKHMLQNENHNFTPFFNGLICIFKHCFR